MLQMLLRLLKIKPSEEKKVSVRKGSEKSFFRSRLANIRRLLSRNDEIVWIEPGPPAPWKELEPEECLPRPSWMSSEAYSDYNYACFVCCKLSTRNLMKFPCGQAHRICNHCWVTIKKSKQVNSCIACRFSYSLGVRQECFPEAPVPGKREINVQPKEKRKPCCVNCKTDCMLTRHFKLRCGRRHRLCQMCEKRVWLENQCYADDDTPKKCDFCKTEKARQRNSASLLRTDEIGPSDEKHRLFARIVNKESYFSKERRTNASPPPGCSRVDDLSVPERSRAIDPSAPGCSRDGEPSAPGSSRAGDPSAPRSSKYRLTTDRSRSGVPDFSVSTSSSSSFSDCSLDFDESISTFPS